MRVSRNESEGARPSAELERIEALYESLYITLTNVLPRRYVMNGAQARELLDGALFAYLQVAVATSQPPEWIQTAVLLEAEALYPKRETPPFADDVSDARKLLDTVRGMGALPASARRALQLRVREGWSFEAIAEELEVSVKYARHLVVSSMAKLRSWRRHELEQER